MPLGNFPVCLICRVSVGLSLAFIYENEFVQTCCILVTQENTHGNHRL